MKDTARLSEQALPIEGYSKVRLGEPNPCLGEGVRLGEACLRRGEEPLHEEKTRYFTYGKLSSSRQRTSGWNMNIPIFSPIIGPFPNSIYTILVIDLKEKKKPRGGVTYSHI